VIHNEESGTFVIERLLVAEIAPDIFVTDWKHPGPDGLELIRTIKAEERLRDLPTVFFSRNAYRSAVARAVNQAADVAIPWPLEADDLFALVVEVTVRGPTPRHAARLLELRDAFYCSSDWWRRATGLTAG
jgi:CheY-like chemotaxis protein